MLRKVRKRSFGHVCSEQIQISLRIRTVWSESSLGAFLIAIIKTSLLKYIENFTTKKWKFSDKKSDFFCFIFLLKI